MLNMLGCLKVFCFYSDLYSEISILKIILQHITQMALLTLHYCTCTVEKKVSVVHWVSRHCVSLTLLRVSEYALHAKGNQSPKRYQWCTVFDTPFGVIIARLFLQCEYFCGTNYSSASATLAVTS